MPSRYPCYASVFGTCSDASLCGKRHDLSECTCGLVVLNHSLSPHVKGRRHKKLLRERRAQEAMSGNQIPSTRAPRRSKNFNGDPAEERRRRQERHAAFLAFCQEAEADKEGITVTGAKGVDFGVIEPGEQPHLVQIKIRKTDPTARIVLHRYSFTSSSTDDPQRGKHFSAERINASRWINYPRTINVRFHPDTDGLYEDRLELLFCDVVSKKKFIILRNVAATVGSRADQEELKVSAPYTPRRRTRASRPPERVVSAGRPPAWSSTRRRAYLGEFEAPKDLIEAAYAEDGSQSMSTQEFREKYMPRQFNLRTYDLAFRIPLHVEEEKLKQGLDAYSMFGVELHAEYPRYRLKVKGLAEGRPSVLLGDYILVKHSDSTEDKWYQGRVHLVYADSVGLQFGEEFSTYRGTKFDVRFQLNRIPHRRMYSALQSARFRENARLLFPGPIHTANLSLPTLQQQAEIIPYNRQVCNNPQQLFTVASIVNLPPGSPPFLVFGPPGTGKTVTIVEAIRQLLHRNEHAKILVCAPSNSAADLIATKLTDLTPSLLLRLNSISRDFHSMTRALSPFARFNTENIFEIPDAEEMSRYRVIVSTCFSAANPEGVGIQRGHFSHIFIDEAGQAKEPECMIPILGMADMDKTNVVLAGDHMQLGPVLHSPLAGALGLRVSYLARLMGMPLYDLGDDADSNNANPASLRGLTIVKLIQNFRSHPAILNFPNTQFYRGQLQPCGDEVITRSLERIEELPRRNFPVIFHGIVGRDQREGDNPSFFNVEEATLVRRYCADLTRRGRGDRVDPNDIGVITPYHKQRCKISTLLAKSNLGDIKVGSVEEFQGQERKVIIMSTVRSSSENVFADIRSNLGFVAEARRVNVALTRARSLLIVIGNPQILALDSIWRDFLSYVHTSGGWRGTDISWDPSVLAGETQDPGFAGETQRRSMEEREDMMRRIQELVTRVHRSEGLLVEEDFPLVEEDFPLVEEDFPLVEEDFPHGGEELGTNRFVRERGAFRRDDE